MAAPGPVVVSQQQQNVQGIPGPGNEADSPLMVRPPQYTSTAADTSAAAANPQVLQGNSWLVGAAPTGAVPTVAASGSGSSAPPPRYSPNASTVTSAPSISSNHGMTAAAWGQQQQTATAAPAAAAGNGADVSFAGSGKHYQAPSNVVASNSLAGHGLMPESDISFAGSTGSRNNHQYPDNNVV